MTRCGVCNGQLTPQDDVIGGRLDLPSIWVDRHKLKHAHLGCYRLVGEYNRIVAKRRAEPPVDFGSQVGAQSKEYRR